MGIQPLTSVIIPVHNGEPTVSEAISSVLENPYQSLEVLVVDDGSEDNSLKIIKEWEQKDERVLSFSIKNGGVSKARNVGLDNANGKYICFLDCDDILPKGAIGGRVDILEQNTGIDYVDGCWKVFNEKNDKVVEEKCPSFEGSPLNPLLELDSSCFIGNTWMIRKERIGSTRFDPRVSHGEDLLFFISLAKKGGNYSYINKPVLFYRIGNESAMRDLDRLLEGYQSIEEILSSEIGLSKDLIERFRSRYKKIMTKAFMKEFELKKALRCFLQ